MSQIEESLASALAAVESGAWADALRLAGRVLVLEPTNSTAFDVISTARRALETSVDVAAERRLLTVVFVDVEKSTRLVSELGAERYRALMLLVHDAAARAIGGLGGRIAQYLGDGILAYFSYPQAHEDDAVRAVRAALDLIGRLEASALDMSTRFGAAPRIRIGIDTGWVVVGGAGAGEWTTVDSVFGDTPHVAARLQSMAPAGSIVISDATRRLIGERFELEAMGRVELAGLPHRLAAHRVVRAVDGFVLHSASHSLVGRSGPLADIEQAWADLLAGQRRDVLVVGEAGIGKTRLLQHLADLATASGGRVVGMEGNDSLRHSTFEPVRSVLRRLFGVTAAGQLTDEALRAALRAAELPEPLINAAVPLLVRLLQPDAEPDEGPDRTRAATMRLLRELFDRLATAGPLVLLIEHIHDLDPSTRELLEHIRTECSAPFLLLATARPGTVDERTFRTVLRLEPLPLVEARTLAAAIAPELGAAQLDRIVALAGGIPLLLVDTAQRTALGDASVLDAATVAGALVTHRLDQLDADARQLLTELAVLATPCTVGLMARLSTLPAARLERALASVVHQQILVPRATFDATTTFEFRHALYQQACYERQLSERRALAHGRCADALLSETDEAADLAPPEVVAAHLDRAGRRQDALAWWRRAGQAAAGRAAHAEAMNHYGRALDAVDALDDPIERVGTELELQLLFGSSSSTIVGYANHVTVDAFARAAELCDHLPDSGYLLPALGGIWSYQLVRGDLTASRRMAERCMRLGEGERDPAMAGVAAVISGTQRIYEGHWVLASESLSRGLGAHGATASFFPQEPAVASRSMLGIAQWALGRSDGIETMAHALDDARHLRGRRAPFTQAYVLCFAAWLAQLDDDAVRAASLAQEAIDLSQEHGFAIWLGAGALHLAAAQCELGELASGLALFEQGLDGWRKAGAELMLPYFLGRYAIALSQAGRHDLARRTIDDAIATAEGSGEACYDAELHRLRAQILLSEAPLDGSLDIDLEREASAALARAQLIAGQQHAVRFLDRVVEARAGHAGLAGMSGATSPAPPGRREAR